jgi:hypothetical protein
MRRWYAKGIARQYFVECHGKPVSSVKTAMATAVRLAGVSTEHGNVTPHTLRHTAATWLMQNGAPLWEAAGYLGMSEKTLRETYGHHHPDFTRGAVEAVGRKPPRREKLVEPWVEAKRRRTAVPQLKTLVVDAVVVEPVSAAIFPANREKNRDFFALWGCTGIRPSR